MWRRLRCWWRGRHLPMEVITRFEPESLAILDFGGLASLSYRAQQTHFECACCHQLLTRIHSVRRERPRTVGAAHLYFLDTGDDDVWVVASKEAQHVLTA